LAACQQSKEGERTGSREHKGIEAVEEGGAIATAAASEIMQDPQRGNLPYNRTSMYKGPGDPSAPRACWREASRTEHNRSNPTANHETISISDNIVANSDKNCTQTDHLPLYLQKTHDFHPQERLYREKSPPIAHLIVCHDSPNAVVPLEPFNSLGSTVAQLLGSCL
jgi:hypothetical protein